MIGLKEKYNKEVIPEMMKRFGYKNVMAVPKIEKVTINTGIGRAIAQKTSQEQKEMIEKFSNDLSLIAGQRPVVCRAKKSISAFKTREGMPLGLKVVLRSAKMYDFLTRLISLALPRSRDFRGIDQKAIGSDGNLTIGIREHIIFPEILAENVRQIFGLEAIIVTTAKTREEGLELLKLMGFPIKESVSEGKP